MTRLIRNWQSNKYELRYVWMYMTKNIIFILNLSAIWQGQPPQCQDWSHQYKHSRICCLYIIYNIKENNVRPTNTRRKLLDHRMQRASWKECHKNPEIFIKSSLWPLDSIYDPKLITYMEINIRNANCIWLVELFAISSRNLYP